MHDGTRQYQYVQMLFATVSPALLLVCWGSRIALECTHTHLNIVLPAPTDR